MHKYSVEVHIDEVHSEESGLPQKDEKAKYIFRFQETSFIAVTSYLSPKVIISEKIILL